jgi:hypothetical protein
MTTTTTGVTIETEGALAPQTSAGRTGADGEQPLLAASGVTKRFALVEALVDVDFEVAARRR